MKPFSARRPAAAWLAAWLLASTTAPAFAQSRVVAPVEGLTAPVAPAVPVSGMGVAPALGAAAPGASLSAPTLSLSAAPAASGSVVRPAAALSVAPAPASAAVSPSPLRLRPSARAASPAAAPSSPARSAAVLRAAALESAAPSISGSAAAPAAATPREAAARDLVAGGVASWGPARAPQAFEASSVRGAASDGPAPLARPASAPAAERPAPPSAPAPEAPRARPRAARAALVTGAGFVALAAVTFTFPALMPASLVWAPAAALYSGFALMSLSRFWRAPAEGVESPRGPPAPSGWFQGLKAVWGQAAYGADAQASLEARAGGSSLASVRNWALGGLRAAALWLPVAVATMLAGWGLAKPFARFANPDDALGMISFDSLEKLSLGGHMLGFVAASLAGEAAVLGVFDLARGLAAKAGAGRAAPWLAGIAAMALSAGLVLLVTTTPSVVGTMLGIEAALLWLRARSGSWLAPLALRGIFSLMSLEFARIGIGLAGPAMGTLAGLPAVWTGVAVAGLLFAGLAWSARSLRPSALWKAAQLQLQRVRDFGAAWRTPRADGAPHSPWPLMKLAALWGMVLYALGDLSFSGIHALTGGAEPTPAVLVQMLSSPVDLVLANFLLVGFLEEFVFRRGIFKPILNRFSKWKLSHPKAFWAAAVVSGLIFSYAHYIDFGALLAHVGLGASGTPVASGMYAFSLGGFAARALLGVVLAWLYASSGTLLLPIVAHFLADSYEGLGLRWGFVPFLVMAAAAVLLQRSWKRGETQRS